MSIRSRGHIHRALMLCTTADQPVVLLIALHEATESPLKATPYAGRWLTFGGSSAPDPTFKLRWSSARLVSPGWHGDGLGQDRSPMCLCIFLLFPPSPPVPAAPLFAPRIATQRPSVPQHITEYSPPEIPNSRSIQSLLPSRSVAWLDIPSAVDISLPVEPRVKRDRPIDRLTRPHSRGCSYREHCEGRGLTVTSNTFERPADGSSRPSCLASCL